MSLPRDYEKEIGEIMILFRAKCTEMNLVNSELAAHEKAYRERYDAYIKLYSEAGDYHAREIKPLAAQLTELRSEVQALQATLLDLLIAHQLRL